MKLNSAEIAADARFNYRTIFNNPTSVDVVGQTGLPGNTFGRGFAPLGVYQAIRLTLSGTGSYTGTNPCTGDAVTNPEEIDLPESENGRVIINYMVPHPVLGLFAGFQQIQSFTLKSTPIEFRLVFVASNSVVCSSSAAPLRTLSGDLTQLAKPRGVALYQDPDPNQDEIAVASSGPLQNRITFYHRTDEGNLPPLRFIEGNSTGLSTPIGIYIDTGHVPNEIGVANNGNNSITIYDYDRTVSGNVDPQPKYPPLTGDQTGLNGPGMVAFDSSQDEIVVANGGNNSVTFYKRNDVINSSDGNVAPIRTLAREFVINDANKVINLTETGGVGNVNVPLANGTYGGGTELAAAVETALNTAVTATGTEFTVTYDNNTGQFTINVTALGSGVSYVTLNWDNAATTSQRVLGFNPVSSGALVSGSIVTSDFGDLTGMGGPCGVYLDTVNNEIGVTNNGNNSITIYNRQTIIDNTDPTTKIAYVSPLRTIRGPGTGLSAPCGLYVDTAHNEIGVVNTGNNSVTIYSRMASGDAPPLRSTKGIPTGIDTPVGIALYVDPGGDPAKDEVTVTNSFHSSLTIHKRVDNSVQLKSLPVLVDYGQQQSLFSQYSYSGTMDKPAGTQSTVSSSAPVIYGGYRYIWKITDDRVRQPGDAASALLFPPSPLELTDGSPVSNFGLDCVQITPFIILQLSTNCPPSPLIRLPVPAPGGNYRTAAILFAQITITKIPWAATPLREPEFPRPLPTLTVDTSSAIQKIDWTYVGEPSVKPLIYSQSVQINLTKAFDTFTDCTYVQVQGNTPKLVFAAGPLPPDVRSLSTIKNNRCDILLDNVDSLIFTVTDALSNSFIYTWKMI